MDCPDRTDAELAEAYVAGTLPEAEQDAFEQHFFACDACLARVRMLQEIKDGVRTLPPAIGAHRPPTTIAATAPWLRLALAAGVVAVVAWWWQDPFKVEPGRPIVIGRTLSRSAEPPATQPGSGSAPTAPPVPVEAPTRHAVLAQLALVTPPRYVPLTVRGEAPAAGSFDAAMAHYVAGRHVEAASALEALSEARPTDPGIAFFWGISALATGRTDDAREGLTRAIAADVQPYEDEAHFYLAKVYLAEGTIDLARQELQYAVQHDAGPEGEAQRMLTALDHLPR